MVQILEKPPTAPKRRHPNPILHCRAHAVELKEVSEIKTPRATETWQPIPHRQLIQTVQRTLAATTLAVGSEAHSLTHDSTRYFGLMEIQSKKQNPDYTWPLGLVKSHDKIFPADIFAGASVFVYDNLSFSGEAEFARKQVVAQLEVFSPCLDLAPALFASVCESKSTSKTKRKNHRWLKLSRYPQAHPVHQSKPAAARGTLDRSAARKVA